MPKFMEMKNKTYDKELKKLIGSMTGYPQPKKDYGYSINRGSLWTVEDKMGLGYVNLDEKELNKAYGYTRRPNTGSRNNMTNDARTDRETYLLYFKDGDGNKRYFRHLPFNINEPLPVTTDKSNAGLFSSDHFLQVRKIEQSRFIKIHIEDSKTGILLGEEKEEMMNDVNKEEGISNAYIEAIITEVHKKADRIDYEAGQMGRASNTGNRMREQVRFYRMGQNHEIPREWKEFEKKLDPEWGEYQRLKEKFEGSGE